MAVNSYLNDNVEGKQFYFSFGSFSTQRSLNLGFKSRFNFWACATPWFFPETQVISYLNTVLKHM